MLVRSDRPLLILPLLPSTPVVADELTTAPHPQAGLQDAYERFKARLLAESAGVLLIFLVFSSESFLMLLF